MYFWRSCLPTTCPYFCFRMITWININGFSPNLLCALILWRSALIGIVNGQFLSRFDSYLPANMYIRPSVIPLSIFSFANGNLIFTKLGNCALILWISGFGLLMGKFRQFLTELSTCKTSSFSFLDGTLNKYQWIFTKCCLHWYCGDLV